MRKVKRELETSHLSLRKKIGLSGLALELRKYVGAEGAVCPNQAVQLFEEKRGKTADYAIIISARLFVKLLANTR